jgi:hypothetical protein
MIEVCIQPLVLIESSYWLIGVFLVTFEVMKVLQGPISFC